MFIGRNFFFLNIGYDRLCCVRWVSQIDRGHCGEARSISIFVKKKILVTEMYIIVNDVCEYDLIYILKVIIVEYSEVHI